jgi:hypothetical protein
MIFAKLFWRMTSIGIQGHRYDRLIAATAFKILGLDRFEGQIRSSESVMNAMRAESL